VSAEESLFIPDSRICAIPFEITDFHWDRDMCQNRDVFYYVDRGADILAASEAINILSNGRTANMEKGDG